MKPAQQLHKLFNSKLIAVLIAIFIFVAHLIMRKYNYMDYKNVLGWDILAYYIYLPFTFIYGDPGIADQSIVQYIFETYQPSGTFYQAFPLPNGNWSPMYTLGFAILYFPFFIIGHIWALLSSYPADGFSYPYQVAISNGVMVYIIGGIFALRKLLKRYFSDLNTTLVLLCMLLGTSFFHEAIAYEIGPHAMMFAGFATILWLNAKWHDHPTMKTAFWLGLVSGLCILARGSGIFVAIIPVLWGVYNKESLLQKINLLWVNYRQILVGFVGLGVFPLIQIIYWKYVTGEFIFNTYQVTPGFDWFSPHFEKVFFSYKKGWLLYTPMIAFCILGLFLIWKNNKKIALSIIVFFIVNVYVISAWGTWWQGGSFGSRYFVDSYPILALPLGYLIKELLQKKLLFFSFAPLAGFFIFLNLFQTWQFNQFMFDGYTMTKAYYWEIFLETEVSEEQRKLAEITRDFKPKDIFKNPEDYTSHTEAFMDFDKVNTIPLEEKFLDSNKAYSGTYSAKITPDIMFGPTYKIPYYELTSREHAWIKVSFHYYSESPFTESNPTFVIEMDHNNGQYIEKRRDWELKSENPMVGEWNYFEIDYLTPYPLSEQNDVFIIYVYVPGNKPINIDDFKVEVFERNW